MKDVLFEVREWIAEGDLEKALDRLQTILSLGESDRSHEAIMLAGRYGKLQAEKRKGIIGSEEENLRFNQLMDGTLSLVKELMKDKAPLDSFARTEERLDASLLEKNGIRLRADRRDPLLKRMAYVKGKKIQAAVLWVDDRPENNRREIEILEVLGIRSTLAHTTDAALKHLSDPKFDMLLSDITRNGSSQAGFDLLEFARKQAPELPFIFYVGHADPKRGLPPYAFGMTDRPDELIHLVLDAIERLY